MTATLTGITFYIEVENNNPVCQIQKCNNIVTTWILM